MIKTRSTYNVNFDLSLTNDVLIEVYIWKGLQSSKPITPEYSFTFSNPAEEDYSKIDISDLVNDFIEYTPKTANNTSLIDSDTMYWVSVDRTEDLTTTNILEDTAINGYSYPMEWFNQDKPSNNILLQGVEFDVSRNTKYLIPIYADGTDITVVSEPNNEIDFSETTVVSTDSNDMLKYLVVDVSETTEDEYIEIDYNNTTITLFIKEEFKYTPLDVHFINKEGAQQVITFFKEQTHRSNFKGEEFTRSGINIYSGEHQFKDFNKNSKSGFKVNSGFVSEEMNETFKQLNLSEYVWIYQNNTFIPVNIESKNIEYKTSLKDRLIRYTLDIKYSFNDIHKV